MQNYDVKFVHSVHEFRIARFVYPNLHPYNNETRMNSPNTLSSPYERHFWNSEQNYPVVNAQPTPTMITPMGQNVPIGYERKLRRIFPIHENMDSKNWHSTERGVSGDFGIGSTGINNSPEMNVKYLRPLDTLTNQEQTNFSRGEAYNHWLSTGAVQSHDIQLPPGLKQVS